MFQETSGLMVIIEERASQQDFRSELMASATLAGSSTISYLYDNRLERRCHPGRDEKRFADSSTVPLIDPSRGGRTRSQFCLVFRVDG